jgi:hypothetical protein
MREGWLVAASDEDQCRIAFNGNSFAVHLGLHVEKLKVLIDQVNAQMTTIHA